MAGDRRGRQHSKVWVHCIHFSDDSFIIKCESGYHNSKLHNDSSRDSDEMLARWYSCWICRQCCDNGTRQWDDDALHAQLTQILAGCHTLRSNKEYSLWGKTLAHAECRAGKGLQPDVLTYNALITALANGGETDRALQASTHIFTTFNDDGSVGKVAGIKRHSTK